MTQSDTNPERVHSQSISGGQIGVAVAGDVHGDINLAPPPLSAAEHLARARNSLLAQENAAAHTACELVLQAEPENAPARLFAALALLGGDYADRVAPPTMQRIEAHLLAATQDTTLAPTAWAILAIIKTDFDTNRQRRTFQHTLLHIKQSLKGAGIDQIDWELLALVHTTERTRRDILS